MKTVLRSLWACSVALMVNYACVARADLSLKDLGLNGCNYPTLASNDDGTVYVAGCQSVRGLYYSHDKGATWKLVTELENTTTESVAIAGNYLYHSYAYRVPLSALDDPEEFSSQKEVLLQDFPYLRGFTRRGDFAFAAIFSGNQVDGFEGRIIRIHIASGAITSVATFPDLDGLSAVLTATDSHLLLSGSMGEGGAYAMHRATLSSGGEVGTFEDITDQMGVPSPNFSRTDYDPSADKVYAATPLEGALYRGESNGTGFSLVSGVSLAGIYHRQFCIEGQTLLIGNYRSLDGGMNFEQLSSVTIEGQDSAVLEGIGCLLDPAEPTSAIISSEVGLATTSDISEDIGQLSFADASKGLQGVELVDLAKDPSNPSTVIVATGSGVALSRNYDSDAPSWNFPFCPDGGCDSVSRVAFSHSQEGVFYMASGPSVYKGTIVVTDDDVDVTFEIFAPGVGSSVVSLLETSQYLPGKLLVGRLGSGVIEFSEDDESVIVTWFTDQTGSAFIALSETLYFAGLGFLEPEPDPASRGVYVSADAGANWIRMVDGDFSALVRPVAFSYSSQDDVLYMATSQDVVEQDQDDYLNSPKGSIFVLNDASSGSGEWQGPDAPLATSANFGISDVLTVRTGVAYAAANGRIWLTVDSGENWSLVFTSSPLTEINTLDFVEGLTQDAEGTFRLNILTGYGAFQLSDSDNGDGGDDDGDNDSGSLVCTAQQLEATQKNRKLGSRTFQAVVVNPLTAEPQVVQVRARIKNLNGDGEFTTVQKRSNSDGIARFLAKMKEGNASALLSFRVGRGRWTNCSPKKLKLKRKGKA
ncbi:MAG: hypothetical protein QY326_05885 [Bdellovibrionota bacterium]|nr:MAG: hypothetical protein QY326_05885 [Bdellovibrionota bacterium]